MKSISRKVRHHPSLPDDHKVLTFATHLLLILEKRLKQVQDYPMTIGPTRVCSTMLSGVRKGARKCTEAQVCPQEGWATHDPYLPQVGMSLWNTSWNHYLRQSRALRRRGRWEREEPAALCPGQPSVTLSLPWRHLCHPALTFSVSQVLEALSAQFWVRQRSCAT